VIVVVISLSHQPCCIVSTEPSESTKSVITSNYKQE